MKFIKNFGTHINRSHKHTTETIISRNPSEPAVKEDTAMSSTRRQEWIGGGRTWRTKEAAEESKETTSNSERSNGVDSVKRGRSTGGAQL